MIEHAEYLRETPVSWLASRLLSGEEVLWRGRIPTLEDLAELETLWSNLGSVRSSGVKVHVPDVYAALHRPECTNASSRYLVDGYLAMLRAGQELEMRVTVRADSSGAGLVERIYDGNKRCAALYESRRNDLDRALALNVFVAAPLLLMARATR